MNGKETLGDLIDAGNSFLISRREFIKRLGVIASTPLLAGCLTREAPAGITALATPKPEYKVATEMFQNIKGSLQLLFTTTRIDVNNTGSGTGFFFQFPISDKESIPIVVTNKHVVSDARIGKFYLNSMDDKGNPILGNPITVEFNNFKDMWLYHPEESVDLCVMPIAPILRVAEAQGRKVFYRAFSPDLIPDNSKLEGLTPIEEVIMVGYPRGLRDEIHNTPIIRKGITATHPALDYNNKPEFVIDIAAFPGSSGSPVLIYNQGSYATGDGITIGTRIYLLGTIYGAPQLTLEGEVVVKDIPIRQEPISRTSIPINLGYVVRSQKILDFESKLKNM